MKSMLSGEYQSRIAPPIRAIALLLCLSLLVQDVVFAHGSESRVANISSGVHSVPLTAENQIRDAFKEMAYIQNERLKPGQTQTVYGIQDAHASLDAQMSIVGILQELMRKHEVRLIGIEGSQGAVDTSLVDALPDDESVDIRVAFRGGEFTLNSAALDDMTAMEIEGISNRMWAVQLFKQRQGTYRKLSPLQISEELIEVLRSRGTVQMSA